ncbi:hypothetical protein [Roseibium sp.]|uniref:hypothetical protein n=1 Tax=Roseibium sp. TaxID=1936156 RepID=UPI003BAE2ED8
MIFGLGKAGFGLFLSFVWLACPATVPTARAAEDVTLYLNQLPHRLVPGTGQQYDGFLKELMQDIAVRVSLKPGPLVRSKTNFLQDPSSCLFPTNIRALRIGSKADTLLSSEQVDVVSLRLYTRSKRPGNIEIGDFAPERVGYIRGSGAVQPLGPNADRFLAIDSEEQLIRMLELNRIDAFLGHHPDTALALEELNKPDALHVSPLPVKKLRFKVTFICHDTETGRQFISAVNPLILKMRLDGRMRAILGPHAEFRFSEETQDDRPLTE